MYSSNLSLKSPIKGRENLVEMKKGHLAMSFLPKIGYIFLLNFCNHCLKGFRVIHRQVSENFSVEVDTCTFKFTHEFGV